MAKSPTNMAKSVEDRLLIIARKEGRAFDILLVRFALERLLYRRSVFDPIVATHRPLIRDQNQTFGAAQCSVRTAMMGTVQTLRGQLVNGGFGELQTLDYVTT